jgi:YVTN family beta-propeller protein
MNKTKAILTSLLFSGLISCSSPVTETSTYGPAAHQRLEPVILPAKQLISGKAVKVGSSPRAIASSSGFIYVASPDEGTISVIDSGNDEVVKTISIAGGSPAYLKAFHDQKTILALDTKQGALLVFDPAGGHKLLQTVSLGKTPDNIEIADDDKTVFVSFTDENGDKSGKVSALTFEADRTISPARKEFDTGTTFKGMEPRTIAFGNNWLAVPDNAANNVSLFNLVTGAEKKLQAGSETATINIVKNSAAGSAIIGNRNSNTVTVFDLNSDSQKTIGGVGLNPSDSAVQESRSRAFITMAGSGEVAVIDYAGIALLKKITVGENPERIYQTAGLKEKVNDFWTGDEFWVSNTGGSVSVIDPDYLNLKGNIKVGQGHHEIAFSGIKAYITNSADGTVSVVDRSNLDPYKFSGPADFVFVKRIITQKCTVCHSITPTHTDHNHGLTIKHDEDEGPAGGIAFDTPEQMKAKADRIKQRAVIEKTMPQDNLTLITQDERDLLGQWADAGAPIN